ncbi:hypothetical protein QBC34DRAFT_52008 [Podospora aff. communis PSN243]|uniref:F-box domain-containing protein n=1 Tax=Podospora aff. communis PSN243 TaxID=3040156 RepID=A0AAV9GTS5_9PEZI|nr:hypothetical protein QBC34DRAFT_52008 [Podospora aff. communis PSN243]
MFEVISPPNCRTWPTITHRNSLYTSGIKPATHGDDIPDKPKNVLDKHPNDTVTKTTYPIYQPQRKGPNLLDLPLEIRLQIYSHIHLSHPLAQPDLSPWYPTPKHTAYFLAPIMTPVFCRSSSSPQTSTTSTTTSLTTPKPNLLSPHRPQSHLPTSLLLSSRQVYTESRTLPFHNNEFVFVTWFSSGLSVARAFVKSLRPWQRDAMRYARIELQIRDLGDVARLAVWEELCGFWKEGMRGLRVKVDLEDADVVGEGEGMGEWWVLGREVVPRTWDGGRWRWVEGGLRRMKGLRVVEVEIVGRGLGDGERVRWCEALEGVVNGEVGRDRRVKVVCVRKAEDVCAGCGTGSG